ncbi:MAG: hypothetical protein ACOYMN_02640 [Roseimicrobium sp.]
MTSRVSPGRNPFTLVEEATHLLRRASATVWLAHYVGSAPFVVWLFFFWSDMSRSPFASSRLGEYALIFALLYVWMKVWQARFSGELLAILEGREGVGRLPLRGWMRLVASQALVHATMPWLLGIASVAVIPVAWVYAFYHNVSILAVGHFLEGGRTSGLLRKALALAHFEPKENHYLLVLLSVFVHMVYANIFVAFILCAQLMKAFTGVENAFTMHPMLFASTALQALLIGLTYLVVNPFIKALYILRCFYGEARTSGVDMAVSLRALARPVVLGLYLWSCPTLLCASRTAAVEPSPIERASQLGEPQGAGATISSRELDRSIRDVLQSSEFQWRLPREAGAVNSEESWLAAQLRRFAEWLDQMAEAMGRFLGDLVDWLFGNREHTEVAGKSSLWLAAMPKLVMGLIVLLVVVLLVMLWRNWRQSQPTLVVEAEAAPPEINLESEHVLASQLPEDEWLRLAREKMDAGELRLALRASFLATLAHLGQRNLLQISRSKSNGDYVRELSWRARSHDGLSESFSGQVRTFDGVWYGWSEVTTDLMQRFEEQRERITDYGTI